MATRQISKTNIVGVSSLAFIRPIEVAFTITDTKPSTRLYGFFDGISIDQYVQPTGGAIGDAVISDSAGRITGTFFVPPMTFHTGKRILRFQDTDTFDPDNIAGSMIGSAQAIFTSTGIKKTLQDTITTINTVENNLISAPPPSPPGDPLAQSFFTFGISGGCFVTKIDIYFESKDTTIPVVLELRELVNGYPGPRLVSKFARVSLLPSQVSVSNTAATATTFTFSSPIYLEENREYCFVLLANSNKYNVWTSKLGEKSIETDKIVFEQPFIGSMFKSENNSTWSAEQTEDIKFTLYKAEFNTGVQGEIVLGADAKPILLLGSKMSVTSGSSLVTIEFDHMHGLRNNDKVSIVGQTNGVYRGITSANITGDFSVNVVDDYTVTFTAASNATSSGTLSTPGFVQEIIVDSGGTGYAAPTIVISGGGGTGATATVQQTGGIITGVTITNGGTGYTSTPTFVLNDSTGSGAVLTLICETIFLFTTNRRANVFRPRLDIYTIPDTDISSTFKTTSEEYSIGVGEAITINEFQGKQIPSMLFSAANQTTYLPSQVPNELTVLLSSTNPNTSPMVNLGVIPKLEVGAYKINNQSSIESITSTNSSGSVGTIVVTAGGTGYGSPTATISAPDIEGGIQATCTPVVSSGIVTSITIDIAGSGYTTTPTVTIIGANTTAASATIILTEFNTELLPAGGTAYSRYLTKPISLATVSTGVRLFAEAYSPSVCSFEFYIRTSLSSAGLDHKTLEWKQLSCTTDRNLSTKDDDYKDYTFSLDNIDQFDVYDIKCVLRSTNRAIVPRIKNYRTIILAT